MKIQLHHFLQSVTLVLSRSGILPSIEDGWTIKIQCLDNSILLLLPMQLLIPGVKIDQKL
jgi:hypothetical protein